MSAVIHQPKLTPPVRPQFTPVRQGFLQRKCECGGKAGSDGECEECRKKKLKRKTQALGLAAQNDLFVPPIVHEVLRSPGQPLDAETRSVMEPRFGHDFSEVRVHADARAAESARSINARAYTSGREIVFGNGFYQPTTHQGKRILAHELTHALQQRMLATSIPNKIASPTEASELEADGIAKQIGDERRLATLQAFQPSGTNKLQRQITDAKAAQQPAHYRFEIKAWIPFAYVPDPEEALHEISFRLVHSDEKVDDYMSEYRGDAHSGYAGSYRVLQVAEFDWDGTKMNNVLFPPVTNFGTSHRDFSAVLSTIFSFPSRSRFFRDEETATADHTVTGSVMNSQEIDLGMSSPNPLTIFPAPNIDADYSIFISQDTFGIETVTVRWTTDLMPNHGFRIVRNGIPVRERIVNALPGPVSAPEIFVRLNSKSNGGSDTFEPVTP